MTDKAIPTITLAELYENQNQYIDALVIYKNLYKENPTEELQNKIDELNNKVFKENTTEYSSIINKIFTEEERRKFHILPHDQFKAYKDSKTDLNNDETYPEELTEINEEETISDDIEKSETGDKTEQPVPKDEEIPEPDEVETPNVDDGEEPGGETHSEEIIEEENTHGYEESMEDDISLEIDEESSDDQEKPENEIEPNKESESTISIEDIIEKKKEIEQDDDANTEEVNQTQEDKIDINAFTKPQNENQILNLITKLSKIRPDIVERVLKENVGFDTSLAEIKLSDLNYVVELLTVSENVEKK